MVLPPPSESTETISVRSVTPLGNNLVGVTLRLSSGALRSFVISADLASFDNVTYCAHAVGELVAAQRPMQ
jgi:hypothetical protein